MENNAVPATPCKLDRSGRRDLRSAASAAHSGGNAGVRDWELISRGFSDVDPKLLLLSSVGMLLGAAAWRAAATGEDMLEAFRKERIEYPVEEKWVGQPSNNRPRFRGFR